MRSSNKSAKINNILFLFLFSDNGLNGDLISDDERSGSELGDDGDSMSSDKVGALNLVTSSDRIRNNNNSSHHNHNNKNNNNNNNNHHHRHLNHHNHHHHHSTKNGSALSSPQSNGHGQLAPSPHAISPTTAASVQAALAALQAGQLSQVCTILLKFVNLFFTQQQTKVM